jgi:23S rRNA-/tRNA-specific pseudouridylate synthase
VSRLADNFWETFWATLPLGRGVTLITRDPNGLAAFSKPAGTLSHPNTPRDQPRSLLDAPYHPAGEYYEWPPPPPARKRQMTSDKWQETQPAPPPAAPPPPPPPSPLDTCYLKPETSAPAALPLATSAPAAARLWLLNRLDSATSGVILAAADESLAREIRALFQHRRIHKTYAALVFGIPPENRQRWTDRLAIEKHRGQIRAAAAGRLPAEARMTLLRAAPHAARPLSLLQLEPETGRSHQLRVQCARRRLPIVGDATYGDFRANRDFAKRTGEKRLFLHSLETRFDYEHAGRLFPFAARAALPEAFEEALRPRPAPPSKT